MAKIILHIGLHKTGTSFIQKRMETNANRLPKGYFIIPRKNKILSALVTQTRRLRSVEEARAQAVNISTQAQKLGRICAKQNITLISHEDLLGPVPTRGKIRGLYPYILETLPSILSGLHASGNVVEVVVYFREYEDWLGSVFRYRFQDSPHRTFRPQRFRRNNNLPENWEEFHLRLQQAVGSTPMHIIPFEKDRATGNLGTALFTIFGLTKEVQDSFIPVEAVNVTDYATVNLG